MKKTIFFLGFFLTASSAFAAHYVNGYTKSNGTYVSGHMAATPNANRWDNPSSQSQGGGHHDEFSTPSATNKSNATWGSHDNDGDGVSNSTDRYPESKQKGW